MLKSKQGLTSHSKQPANFAEGGTNVKHQSRINLKELYEIEGALIPITILLSSVIYALVVSFSDTLSFKFGEMLWVSGLGIVISQLFVVELLRKRAYRAVGVKRKPANPPHTRQTDFTPMASGIGFNNLAPTRKVNGATKFFSAIPTIFTKQGKAKGYIVYREPRRENRERALQVGDPMSPDVKRAVMSEIKQPLLFKSRPATGGVVKGMQVSGRTMILFLTYAYKNNRHGKGLSRNYWATRTKVRHHSDWWQPMYYPHVMDIIKHAEEITNIQIIVITENNWKRLTMHPKLAFAVMCYAHFPHLYEEVGSFGEVKKDTDKIIGRSLKRMI